MSGFLRKAIERWFHARITECAVLRVVSTRRITPHMLRVSFEGTDLEAFDTEDNWHVKLLLPPVGARRDCWLHVRPGGKAVVRAKGHEPIFRKYTIRSIDAAAGRLEIDFVLHADGGPGAAWAATAAAGDVVGIVGPGGRGLPHANWYLIAGDETALPAIGRMSETMARDARGIVIIEVEMAEERQNLVFPPGVELRWLHRGGRPSQLPEALGALTWPEVKGQRFAWVAGEFDVIQNIRRFLRSVSQLERNQILAVAYWRHT